MEDAISDDEEDGDVQMTYPVGLGELVNIYTSRTAKTVQTWSANLRRMTTTQPLKAAEDGTLWTASDVEFFRLLNEQLEVAMSGGKLLVSAAAIVISSALSEFASEQYKRLSGEGVSSTTAALASPSFSRHFRTTSNVVENAAERAVLTAAKNVDYNVLLAGVNDASRCHRLALEIESSLVDALQSSETMEKLVKRAGAAAIGKSSVVRPAIDIFITNTEHCAAAAAAAVTSDPSVMSLFGQMYAVEKGGNSLWLEGEVTETMVATVLDYLGDVMQFVTRELAPKVNEAVFTRVVKHMIEACMKQLQTIRPGTVDRMEEDENALRECFEDFLPSNRLDLGLQRLADVRDLAAADDTESFVLAYGLVVQSMPELGIEPAERLLAAREDIPRATQREVLEECRELLSNQMALTK
jgi:exocyst complex component 3